MAKPKAPAWLTTAFAEGVIELAPPRPAPAYKGALGRCWLAQHDERRRPCEGRLERAHVISRQRVGNALGALLPWGVAGTEQWNHFADLIQLAEWDSRNAIIVCEGHHRRFDSHLTPALTVPLDRLPDHVITFAHDWGIEGQLDRFPV